MTCSKLEGKQEIMKGLRIFLQRLFSTGRCIPESSSIHNIFCAITGNKLWDSWNYYPLEKIVEKFAADDTEIASWIEAYVQDLESYKVSTKLFDYISAADSNSTVEQRCDKQYYQKLSVKLRMKCLDQTMDYIDNLWDEIAGLFGLPPCVVLLDSIRKDCVSIVWYIPSHIAPKILNAAPPSDEFYHKHEITRVEYDGEGIYQEGEVHIARVYQRSHMH